MTTPFAARMEATILPRVEVLQRKPQRVNTTVSWELKRRLQERADYEGRSLSNLIAHLLEKSIGT